MSEEYLNYNYKMPVNKGKQKQLITDIMNADAKDGLYKQQTAVEWLYTKLSTCTSEELVGNINKWFEQAKEMEKEQITDSYIMGSYDMANKEFRPEQYYNKTYGGNK